MKLLLTMLFLIPTMASANCSVSDVDVDYESVVHEIDTKLPAFLKGAKIKVTLADGTSSEVPAELFKVVPRKQQLIVGHETTIRKETTCKVDDRKKNIIMASAKETVTSLETKTSTIPNGVKASVSSNKGLVPGIKYYREDILENLGAGVGVDTNGEVEAMIGVGF